MGAVATIFVGTAPRIKRPVSISADSWILQCSAFPTQTARDSITNTQAISVRPEIVVPGEAKLRFP
ncbi:unnamed protein product [Gemmata massiliana]|uniref:Uncharacterized protein n=1 Tax=Gemmata massiliana TaxID=1210884 RepID=A0A6P2DCL9_9BACT|nr:hypothetical protein [Gemmata massiliana]VTR98503.1 unnamed protein product [Gemmata massiliana]